MGCGASSQKPSELQVEPSQPRSQKLMDINSDLLDWGKAKQGSSPAMSPHGRTVEDGKHAGQPYVYRVVLTGGPCGGKSSSLAHFTKELNELGFDVYTVPEVPTIMMNGGCVFPGTSDDAKLLEFESALLQLQLQSERSFLQVASSTHKPSVVVMDRGVNDIKAYMSGALWEQLLQMHGLNEEYINQRYDLVLHLVTAADGCEEFYTTANNTARKETAEEARQLDKLIEAGYSKSKEAGVFARIDNSTDFKGKLENATAAVMNMLKK